MEPVIHNKKEEIKEIPPLKEKTIPHVIPEPSIPKEDSRQRVIGSYKMTLVDQEPGDHYEVKPN